MQVSKYESQLYVLPVENNLGFKIVDEYKLYSELSQMDDVTRIKTIKNMNDELGYEGINYKLLKQLYKTDIVEPVKDIASNQQSSTLERDYIKAYMKLLSN